MSYLGEAIRSGAWIPGAVGLGSEHYGLAAFWLAACLYKAFEPGSVEYRKLLEQFGDRASCTMD